MKKFLSLILVMMFTITLTSITYAETNSEGLGDKTTFIQESEDKIITPFNLVINEPSLNQRNGRYSDEVFSVAKNLDIYFYNTSEADVEITVQNLDRPQFEDSYTVALGKDPTKRYHNIKAGEHYIIRLKTVDGSCLTGNLRVKTYN
ncbi:MAG: hypothetical protein AB2375_01870 [Tissierellaceae bacterium]